MSRKTKLEHVKSSTSLTLDNTKVKRVRKVDESESNGEVNSVYQFKIQQKYWDLKKDGIFHVLYFMTNTTNPVLLMNFRVNRNSLFAWIISVYLGDNHAHAGLPPIGTWDVSGITDMSNAFNYDSSKSRTFNENINNWDVSSVTDMSRMFAGCEQFNQPLDMWETSNVTDMNCMFMDCKSFNQSLNSWNTSNVTNMFLMFLDCENLNQSFNKWKTSKVTNMESMFFNCASLNTSARLDCSSCETLLSACENCTSLTYPLFDEETFSSNVDTHCMYKNTNITLNFPKTVALQIMLHGGFRNDTFVLPTDLQLVRVTSKECGEVLHVLFPPDLSVKKEKFRWFRMTEPSTNFFYKMFENNYNEIDSSSSLDELRGIFNRSGRMPNLVETIDHSQYRLNKSNQLTHVKANKILYSDLTENGKTNLRVNFFQTGDTILNKHFEYKVVEDIIPSVFLCFHGEGEEEIEADTADSDMIDDDFLPIGDDDDNFVTTESLKSLKCQDILPILNQFGVLYLSELNKKYETTLQDILMFLKQCGCEKFIMLDSSCSTFMHKTYKQQHKAKEFPFQQHPNTHLQELQQKYPSIRHSPYINLGGQKKTQAKRAHRQKTRVKRTQVKRTQVKRVGTNRTKKRYK